LGQNPKSQLIIPFTARGAAHSISRKVTEFPNRKNDNGKVIAAGFPIRSGMTKMTSVNHRETIHYVHGVLVFHPDANLSHT
jgi:hypothetical protein